MKPIITNSKLDDYYRNICLKDHYTKLEKIDKNGPYMQKVVMDQEKRVISISKQRKNTNIFINREKDY